MAIKYRENGQSVTRANIGGGGGSTQITVETPTVTNATPYKYTGSALGPTITWDSSAMANYVNITNATGTAVGQYVLTLALKNPTLSMWDDLTTADKTYNYDIIPDGATATANDVQTLLKCADIFDKDYTTISQVLADNTAMQTIISSENASDYLARSTSFASAVCADSTAMSLIGLNDYTANKLLADSTWCTAICNSTYFESVLTKKIPVLSSNSGSDGGEAFASQSNEDAYLAFDGDDVSKWTGIYPAGTVAQMTALGYHFANNVRVYKTKVVLRPTAVNRYYYQYSDNGSDWTNITEMKSVANPSSPIIENVSSNGAHSYYRIMTDTNQQALNPHITVMQFYGREAVS